MWVRQGAYLCAPLRHAPTIVPHVRLGWKTLSQTNDLTYLVSALSDEAKQKFYDIWHQRKHYENIKDGRYKLTLPTNDLAYFKLKFDLLRTQTIDLGMHGIIFLCEAK